MKTKALLSICTGILASLVSYSQTYITQVKTSGGDWGYANLKGDLIIPAEFDKCYQFTSDGLAVIFGKKERQYYFIDTKGNKLATEVTSFKIKDGLGFDVAGFQSGLIAIKIGDKWGYFNTKGKLAIPAQYEEALEFNNGYGVAQKGKDYVVLNTSGKEFAIDEPGIMDVKPFKEGLAPYRASDKTFGFIGADGKVAIKAQFESVGYFTNGLAWAKTSGGTLGYIDKKGAWVIKPQFEAGKNFDAESGLARVKLGKDWAYTDKAGKLTYIKDTEAYGDFSNGLAEGKQNKKSGFYDKTGKWIIEPKFDAARDFQNGYAAVKMGDKWGVIDKTGKWVMEPKYDGIKDMELVK